MSEASNSNVGCMADRYMLDYERAAAAGYGNSKSPDFVLLAAILRELRGLRADLKEHNDRTTAVGQRVFQD